MDPASFGAHFSIVRDHLQLFAVLLFALPTVSFLSMKCWTAGHSARVQRTTNWFVPTDLESESAKLHYSMGNQSIAFANRAQRNTRHAVAVRISSSRRSA